MPLKQIFDAITPDNIKNIDLLADAMEIFIENLEQNAAISIDIKEIYNSENNEIKEALLKIYLNSLYTVITQAQENKLIADKLEYHDAKIIPLKNKITDILNNEYLTTNKSFKQKLGTKSIIEYTYNLTKYLQDNVVNASDFKLTEVKPFYFRTEGSIYNELYEYVVKPLSHPIGFTYNYVKVIAESIADFFGLTTEYKFNKIEVRSLDGTYHVFSPDLDDTNIKADFLTRVNFLTNKLFTEEEFYEQVHLHLDHQAIDLEFNNVNGSTEKIIYFSEGTILKQTTNPITVYYRQLSDEQENNENYEERYNSQSSLYVDYEQVFSVNYYDSIKWDIDIVLSSDLYNILDEAIDIFNAQLVSENGYYLYSTDFNYFFTTDEWYLYAYDL